MKKQTGFTIVELLVVIVVIGILAAITIVAYNGVQNRAQQAVISADFSNTAKASELFYSSNAAASVYPSSTANITQAGIKLTKSSYNAAVWCYSSDRSMWALVADSKDGKSYYISNIQRTMTEYTAYKVQGNSGASICPAVNASLVSWAWLTQCPTCAWTI